MQKNDYFPFLDSGIEDDDRDLYSEIMHMDDGNEWRERERKRETNDKLQLSERFLFLSSHMAQSPTGNH